MGSLKVYATLAGFLAAASSATAVRAADLLPPPPPMPVAPAYAEVAGGWYLRGDVGVSAYDAGKIRDVNAPAGTSYYDRDFGSGGFAGAGAGYQFNSWFRADVTGEYRFSTGINYRDKSSFYTPGQIGGYFNGVPFYSTSAFTTTNYERTATDFSSAVVLVNGYIDFGTWNGFTLFGGAGVGYAYHFTRGGTTDTTNVYGPFVNPNDGTTYVDGSGKPILNSGTSGGSIKNRDHGDFAWALYAGVAYDVTPNLKLELGYRYLNLGEVQTGVINCFCGDTKVGVRVKDLEAHDIKLGMRWALGGTSAAPIYEPAPLIRKY